MFSSLIDHAKLRVSSATTRLVGRVVVGVLFLIAAGFGVAAIQIALIDAFGAIMACIIMAAAFVLLALLVAVIVVLQQRHQDAMLRHTAQQSAKDPGAYLVGAAQKKSTTPLTQTAMPSTATPRWIPPPSTTQHPRRSAVRGERGNATTQNATGRGANRYNARGRQKNRPTSTRYTGQKHPSA